MFIRGIGTAIPEHSYTQLECWEALRASGAADRMSTRARAILRKVLTSENGIETRNLCVSDLQDAISMDPDVLHERFSTHAPRLASRAASAALSRSAVPSDSIDAVIVSTCTGYLCPGLSSYVVEALNLGPSTQGFDLVGQGCAAAMPNLALADALVASGRAHNVLCICVEVCSAAFYLDEDPGVLVSACLFADGAAAAVVGNTPGNSRPVEWVAAGSRIIPSEREQLRFQTCGGLLKNVLAPQVPQLASTHVKALFDEMIKTEGLDASDISAWILHPGGRDVIAAVGEKLGLHNGELAASKKVLLENGNISSPSVLYVLEETLNASARGGYWWMSSFGAGFSCHGAILKVD